MQENNKRIAKNTLMLYFRMMLIMGVALYTSRVVLEVLGVEDFGIYNIVGGIVVMFGFLNSAMSTATQRFLSFELGRKDYEQLKKVFSLSVTIHALIAVVIFILAETIGLWFLNTQLTIPTARMEAANWVYQFSIFAFMVNVMAVPYNAAIVSHERMNVYAYVSIIEVILKLAIVFLLQYFGFDKLKLYAILVFIVSFIVRMVYQVYCKRKFEECTYRLVWDKKLFKELTSFSGWSLFGGVANMGATQGLNMILNIFLGVGINAAMGIANQVGSAVYQFISNFQTAFRPQIIKTYTESDKSNFYNLIFQSSKYSYLLMFILSLPILICTEEILNLWLVSTPEYTAVFCRLMIIFLLLDAIQAPLWLSVQATGVIRNYQIIMSIIIISNLPLSYFLLKHGVSPTWVLWIRIILNLITFCIRLIYLSKKIGFPSMNYIRYVISSVFLVSFFSIIFSYLIYSQYNDGGSWFMVSIVSILSSIAITFLIGLEKTERKMIIKMIQEKIKRRI